MFDDDNPDGGGRAAVMSGDPGETGPAGGGTVPAARVRSWLATPLGVRLVGAAFAVAGVALLVVGLITLRGQPSNRGGPPPGANPTTAAPTSPTASTSAGPSATPSSAPTSRPSASPTASTSRPAPVQRVPLTVLNNSVQPGLAESAAARFTAGGWQVALIGNFAGRIPSTTVYYTPGDAIQQRAATALAAQFRGIHRVMSRYAGLPPTPPGLVVVLTSDWTG